MNFNLQLDEMPNATRPDRDILSWEARRSALAAYHLLPVTPHPGLDEITRLAALICNAPVAAISLLTADRAALLSAVGIDMADLPLPSTPWKSTILAGQAHALSDTSRLPADRGTRIVVAGQRYAFYAAAPLLAPSGVGIGTLFILDLVPRTLTPLESQALSALSNLVLNHFELHRSRREVVPVAPPVVRSTTPGPYVPVRSVDRMKDEFIATISHECRTPLTSLRAALGLITGGGLAKRPEKMQQMLDIAVRSTNRLVELVDDILDLDRIERGKSQLHRTDVSAQDLLVRAAALHPEETIRLNVSDEDVILWADSDRILQALTSLISNAIKFSPRGSAIELGVKKHDDDVAEISICDHGTGIPAAKLEHIFERFHQIDSSDSRASGGSGLGLALCRTIITQHGGRIWATSKPGDGTTLHFTLPTRPPA